MKLFDVLYYVEERIEYYKLTDLAAKNSIKVTIFLNSVDYKDIYEQFTSSNIFRRIGKWFNYFVWFLYWPYKKDGIIKHGNIFIVDDYRNVYGIKNGIGKYYLTLYKIGPHTGSFGHWIYINDTIQILTKEERIIKSILE